MIGALLETNDLNKYRRVPDDIDSSEEDNEEYGNFFFLLILQLDKDNCLKISGVWSG